MLEGLDFGRDAAESEQDFLQQVFVTTPVFHRVKSGRNWLILGRKGSGKTAMCLELFRELQNQQIQVSLITPASLSLSIKSGLEKGAVNSAEASMLLWKYIFLLDLSKNIVRLITEIRGGNYLSWSASEKRVRRFLVQGEEEHANLLDKLLRRLSAIKKIDVKFLLLETSIEGDTSTRESFDLRDLLDSVSRDIIQCMVLYNEQNIYFLVDKIDELWSLASESSNLIIGLLRASMEIREQFSKANIILFLRSDIYDQLSFHDSDKYHSIEERLMWEETSLLKLISSRIRVSIEMSRSFNDIRVWRTFFPEQLYGEDSFRYLLRYTLMRPRDLIQLCNRCKNVAENSSLEKINEISIRKAIPEYSRWKLKDLEDEYLVQYPFLGKVFWGVFQNAPHRFDRSELNRLIEPYLQKLCSEFGDVYFNPLDRLLQILIHIGFIGAVKGNQTIYYYQGFQVIVPYTIPSPITRH